MTILTQELVFTDAAFNLLSAIVILGIIGVGGGSFCIYLLIGLITEHLNRTVRFAIKAIYCALWIFAEIAVIKSGIDEYNSVPHEVMEYKVTLDDSVSFNSIAEKYNIIEVDGKLITIRDKQ